MDIVVIDRKTGTRIKEVVAGESLLQWSCRTFLGRVIMEAIGSRKMLSTLMGFYQNSTFSKKQIHRFVETMEIKLDEAERPKVSDYKSFNDFFSRKLNPGARTMDANDSVVISPADGRVLAYPKLEEYQMLQIKGKSFSIMELLADSTDANIFKNGCCVVVRLNPSDYHRFHFPVTCIPGKHKEIKGRYYSVNPVSLMYVDEVYCKNVRHICYLKGGKLGRFAMVEVGASLVGSVVQTYQPDSQVKKGEEKGFFQFGGSTVIMLFQPGHIILDADLIANTMDGYETLLKMGDSIGKVIDAK